MNPGALEEAGKFANSVANALGSQPMALGMILTNIMLLVFLFYSQASFYEQRQELSKKFLDETHHMMELMSKCIVPPRSQ